MPDDAELMARVKEGDEIALERLLDRWELRLFAFFCRLGCPPGSAGDLAEEVLVALYRQRHRYDASRPFAPWLYGIARIVWKNDLRRGGRESRRMAPLDAGKEVPSSAPSPARLAEVREEVAWVRAAVQDLPGEQRAAFVLRHYQGLRYEEIAEALQIPVGTVKWRIHESVRRLAATMSPDSPQRTRVQHILTSCGTAGVNMPGPDRR